MQQLTNRFLLKAENTGQNQWWMYVLGIFSAITGYLTFLLIIRNPLYEKAHANGISNSQILKDPNILFNPNKMEINKNIMFILLMLFFVFTLFFFVLAIKFIHKKTLASVITSFENIRWNRYFFAFTLWGSLIILLTVVSYLVSPQDMEIHFDFSKFIVLLVVAIIFVPIQTATEEIIFRGYLMQGLGLAFKSGIVSLIITSVLFGLLHLSNPEAKAHGWLLMLPYYSCFGMFLAMLTLLDEGLELAMGIHCANNLISSLLVTSKNSVLQTDAIFYTSVENPAGEFLMWIAMAALCFFVFYKKYKLTNFKLLIR